MSRVTLDEQLAVYEQAAQERFERRRVEVEPELTFTLNLLDRVEDDTWRLYARMVREAKGAYDTRFAGDGLTDNLLEG